MTKKKKHFDEDLDLRVPPKLSADLNTLFKPQFSVPPEVDRAVIDRANRHLVQRLRRHRLLRWAGPVAAAAAIIIFAFVLDFTKEHGQTVSLLSYAVAQTDIDQNGRVDILDAFKLARHIESAEGTEARWDINGDGMVDRKDVDSVAFAAVRLDKGVL